MLDAGVRRPCCANRWPGSTRTSRATSVRRRSPVRIHVNHEGWIDLDDWPPPMPEQVRYLQPGGRLGDAVPPDTAPASAFTYDPADPTPTVGGRLLSPRGRLPQRHQAGGARRRAELHRRRAVAGPLCRRKPGHRTVALLRQPAQRLVRAGQRGGRQGAVPQRQRRISPRHTNFRHRHHRNGCRSRTGSAPDRASGCWSPVVRIRGSRAISAPANRSSPAVGCGRPRTPCTSVTGASRLRLPAGAPTVRPTESRTRAAIVAQRRVVVHRRRPHRVDRQRHPARAARVVRQSGQPHRLGQRARPERPAPSAGASAGSPAGRRAPTRRSRYAAAQSLPALRVG